MKADEWLETYGEPKEWELATAILEQIESYRNATLVLIYGPNPRPNAAITKLMGMSDEQVREAVIDNARRRVSRPVVDIDEARKQAGSIGESGGWGAFIRDLD
jgi:hypothetical protein